MTAGKDDRDEMGVCVEPRRFVVGFGPEPDRDRVEAFVMDVYAAAWARQT
jgi:hypothetical protein